MTAPSETAAAEAAPSKQADPASPPAEEVESSVEDRILLLRLNRPQKKNALTLVMYQALADALRAAEADPGIRATVITGSGDSFTAGNDLMDFMKAPPSGPDSPVVQFLYALLAMEKPLVGAVNGTAIGIGTTMLLHCDFSYAVAGARLQVPFVDLGLVPEAASSLLLARRIGAAKAAEMLMLGESITAEDAADARLVNGVCTPDALLDTAMATARKLADKAPAALRLTKRLMRGDGDQVRARMDAEFEVFRARLKSPELAEAVKAFMTKRPPNFSKFS